MQLAWLEEQPCLEQLEEELAWLEEQPYLERLEVGSYLVGLLVDITYHLEVESSCLDHHHS